MTTTVHPMTLQKRIIALPKVLQDSISMFNADHRQEMQPVFSELIDKYAERYFMCDNMDCYDCDIEIFDRPIVKTILFQEYYFCCERCEGEGTDNIYRCYRKYKAQQRR
jgi:hypothetical protein